MTVQRDEMKSPPTESGLASPGGKLSRVDIEAGKVRAGLRLDAPVNARQWREPVVHSRSSHHFYLCLVEVREAKELDPEGIISITSDLSSTDMERPSGDHALGLRLETNDATLG